MIKRIVVFTLLLLSLLPALPVAAQEGQADPLLDVGFEQRLDAQVPFELTFLDEEGREVRFGDYFGTKPVLLALGYYQCPMLCPIVRDGLVEGLTQVKDYSIGEQFTVVHVSIDPRETPADAAVQKAVYLRTYNRAGAEQGWHFLTGEEQQIRQLADSVGFGYVYDEKSAQYSHPSGIVMITPEGRVARYLFGVEYRPIDLRLGLVETSAREIGTPIDQLLLLCFHYNPVTGQYTGLVMTIVRVMAIITTAGIIGGIILLSRRNPQTPLTGV